LVERNDGGGDGNGSREVVVMMMPEVVILPVASRRWPRCSIVPSAIEANDKDTLVPTKVLLSQYVYGFDGK
jgi:hypothetical protein